MSLLLTKPSLSLTGLTEKEKEFCSSVFGGPIKPENNINLEVLNFIHMFLEKRRIINGGSTIIDKIMIYIRQKYDQNFELPGWISIRKFVGYLHNHEKNGSTTVLADTVQSCLDWKLMVDNKYPKLPVSKLDPEMINDRCDELFNQFTELEQQFIRVNQFLVLSPYEWLLLCVWSKNEDGSLLSAENKAEIFVRDRKN